MSTLNAVTCFKPSAFLGIGLAMPWGKIVHKMLHLLGGWASLFPLLSGKVEPETMIMEMCAEMLHLQCS